MTVAGMVGRRHYDDFPVRAEFELPDALAMLIREFHEPLSQLTSGGGDAQAPQVNDQRIIWGNRRIRWRNHKHIPM